METTRIIEQYLEGSLTREEQVWVEEKIAIDHDFKELITLHSEVNESIGDQKFAEFQRALQKASIAHLNEENQSDLSIKPAKNKRMFFLKIAAVFILVACSGMVIKFLLFQPDHLERLYNQNYQAYQPDVISRSAESTYKELEKAIINYSNKNYDVAYASLNTIINADPRNYTAWFYKGLTCLEQNRAGEAVLSLEAIPSEWDSLFREHRDWYLALAYLKNNQTKEAAILFRKISEQGEYYADKAQKICLKLTK
jgi:tetratricopeptide (TPR) repeat protein